MSPLTVINTTLFLTEKKDLICIKKIKVHIYISSPIGTILKVKPLSQISPITLDKILNTSLSVKHVKRSAAPGP